MEPNVSRQVIPQFRADEVLSVSKLNKLVDDANARRGIDPPSLKMARGAGGGGNPSSEVANVICASTANVASLAGGIGTNMDGHTLQAGDLILLKNQGSPGQNGVYTVATGAWVQFSPLKPKLVSVSAGTISAGLLYFLTAGSGLYTPCTAVYG